MKVLFVINDAHGWAGTERVVNLIANGLSGRFDVEVLSLRPCPEKPRGYPYDPRVALSYLPLSSGAAGFLVSNARAAEFVARGSYDAVVLAGVGEIKYFLLVAFKIGARRKRPKLVAWEHFNAAYTYKRLNRKAAARCCDAVVALTERDTEDWRRLLKPCGAIVAIPNPIPEFPDRAAPLDSARILALGRLEEQKRFDLLIDAFSVFAASHPGWTLRIRGSGSKEDEIKKKVSAFGLGSRVEILKPTDNVASEYVGASMYVMSSKFEGFPMTLVEAMAYGVPCVSFDCPNGPLEIIRDGQDGFIVPLYDVAALAGRMGQLADDAALRARMGAAARKNIGRYEIGPILERWAAFLEGLWGGL